MTTRAATLVLDAALDACLAAVTCDGAVLAERRADGLRASTSVFPSLAAEVLHASNVPATGLSAIAVTIGPGSFTGVRAALALAHGIGLAASVPVIGVTLADAIRADAPTTRPIWVAIDSKRGRIFLARPEHASGEFESVALDAIPTPTGPIAITGNAAIAVASRMAARGNDIQLLPQRRCSPLGVARAATTSPRPALPLYIDPVAARPSPLPLADT